MDKEDLHLSEPWTGEVQTLISRLSVDIAGGLSPAEVEKKRQKYGPNQTRKKEQRSAWTILLEQFKSLIVVLLLIAGVVAFAAGEQIEAAAILAVILINAGIGFFVEIQAVRSMEALRELGKVEATVRRGGEIKKIPAEELVVGDVVIFEAGDVVSADLRLLEANNLQADESVLTGESVPVEKTETSLKKEASLAERVNMLFKGTAITRGSGEAVVVATGPDTELGQISSLVESAEEEVTPLEERLEQLGHKLIWLTLFVALLVTVSGVLVGKEFILMVETGIALAVAAIPEGLPIVATIALARGMLRMARRHALIRRLSAVETLGSTGIICTDKTGTLTENRLTVTRFILPETEVEVTGKGLSTEGDFKVGDEQFLPGENNALTEALKTGILCNNASLPDNDEPVGEPLEVALLVAGRKAEMPREELLEEYPEIDEYAFNSDQKMMGTVHELNEGGYRLAVKGAPESVLKNSEYHASSNGKEQPLSNVEKEKWLEKSRSLAEEGLRVLALATRVSGTDFEDPYEELVFQGLVAFLDPPRKEMRAVLDRCQGAGLRTIMVTGDHPVTARRIGEEVGLVEKENAPVKEGRVLENPEELTPDQRGELLGINIFARVSPAQKLNLIDLHQGSGSVVAMTGDGVNDAPALKKADIGVAMGQRGTQVAQDAADMVLTDDAFSTIVAAIEQGRTIFNNIRSFVLYLLSCNISEILAVGLASVANIPLPILPLQILFLNLVTDVFPALALGMGESEEEIMHQPPRDPKSSIVGFKHWFSIGGYGAILTATVLGTLALALAAGYPAQVDGEPGPAITISFYTLALTQLWHVFNMRNQGTSLFQNNVVTNPYVWGALVLCVGLLTAVAVIPPLASVLSIVNPGFKGWILVAGMSLVPVVIGQFLKFLPVNIFPVGN